MWIGEALHDPPHGGRTALAMLWLRSLALAGAAVGLGSVVRAAWNGHGLLAPALATGLLVAIGALAGGAAEGLVGRMRTTTETTLRSRVMAAALGRGGADGKSTDRGASDGQVLEAATRGVEKVADYRAGFLMPTLAAFTAPVLVLAVWAVAIGPLSALVLLAFVAAVPGLIVLGDRALRRSNGRFRREQSQASARYLELVEGLGTISVLGAGTRVLERYARSARGAMTALTRLLARNQLVIVVHDAVFGVLMGCVAVALVLHGTASGRLDVGAALTGVLLTVLLQEPMSRVGRTFYVALGGRARRDQIDAMLEEAEAGGSTVRCVADASPVRRCPDASPMRRDGPAADPGAGRRSAPPALELRGIRVVRGGASVLEDLTLRIPSGARVALVGPSGAGKTSLLRILAGLEEPADGQILVDGRPLTAPERQERAAMLTQHVELASTTIADNLRVVAPAADDATLDAALTRAGLAAELARWPEGIHTAVGEGGALLSGGQRRRVGLARLLLQERSLLILDEPTADLDRESEQTVRALLADAQEGRTVIETSHRLRAALEADLVIVLESGRVSAIGSPQELRERPGYVRRALAAEEQEPPQRPTRTPTREDT